MLKGFIGNRRVVDELNQKSVRITEVEGSGAVPVGFGLLRQRNAMTSKPFGPLVNLFGAFYDKTDMVDCLHLAGFGA